MKKVLILFLIFGTIFPIFASNQERDLQAVFLGRFAKFIELPKEDKKFFYITLIDENPFDNLLDDLYKDKKIHNKPIKINYVTRVEDIGYSDILFITLDNKRDVQESIDYAKKNSILTISQQRGFAQRGGIIQLSFIMQKVNLVINNATAKKSKIKIKAPLLAIAQKVIRGDK